MPSPNPPRQVLIVETRLEGHHPKWVGMSVVAFRGLGAKVTVAAAEPEALRERAAANLEGAEVDFIPLGTAAHGLPSVRAAANLAKAHEADLCFWPTLDNFASALLRRAAFGGRPPESLKGLLAGVYHRPRPLDARERGFGRALKRAGFARLHREGWWNAIFVLDPGVAADVARDFPGLRCALVPDPHEWPALPARDEARRKLDIPRDALVLLHFGTEARRKGLDLTLDALARSRAADKLFLLRAGQSAPDSPAAARVRELEKAGRARLLDRYVSAEEEQLAYSAADIVLLPYWSHYGSANLLAGAAAAGRPVLASDFHLVGRLTRENLLGWTFRDRDAGDFARALDLLAQTTPAVRAEFAPALAAYAAASTRGVLIRRIQEMFSGSDRAAISNLP